MMNYRNDITSEIRKTTSQEMKAVKVKHEQPDYVPLFLFAIALVAVVIILMLVL